MDSKEQLLTFLSELAGRPVRLDENILSGVVDSLALVEVINFIEQLALQAKREVDLEYLVTGKSLTAEMILRAVHEGV